MVSSDEPVTEDDMDKAGVETLERLEEARERASACESADNNPAADFNDGEDCFLNIDCDWDDLFKAIGDGKGAPAGMSLAFELGNAEERDCRERMSKENRDILR